jgi:transketolase N-terminal domain/subunit
MPLSRKEFDEGEILSDTERKIIAFLESNRSQSFLQNEIMEGIKVKADFSSVGWSILSVLSILSFGSILDGLATKRKIERKYLRGQYYYTAK